MIHLSASHRICPTISSLHYCFFAAVACNRNNASRWPLAGRLGTISFADASPPPLAARSTLLSSAYGSPPPLQQNQDHSYLPMLLFRHWQKDIFRIKRLVLNLLPVMHRQKIVVLLQATAWKKHQRKEKVVGLSRRPWEGWISRQLKQIPQRHYCNPTTTIWKT